MSPKCETCRWTLAFIRKAGQWIAVCRNPACPAGVIDP